MNYTPPVEWKQKNIIDETADSAQSKLATFVPFAEYTALDFQSKKV
jgi:hypothetical protein